MITFYHMHIDHSNLVFYDNSSELDNWGTSKIDRFKNIVETNDFPLLDCISALMGDEFINRIMQVDNRPFKMLDNNFIVIKQFHLKFIIKTIRNELSYRMFKYKFN